MDRFKKQKIIKPLIISIFILSTILIGYAFLTQNLKISGYSKVNKMTWDVHFENIKFIAGNITPTKAATLDDATSLSFNVAFNNPGEFYEFSVDVVNDGSIDAMIGTITKEPVLTQAQEKYLIYEVKYKGVKDLQAKDSLPAGTKETLNIKIKIQDSDKMDIADLPGTLEELALKLEINYIQGDTTAKPVDFTAASEIKGLYTTAPVENSLEQDNTNDHNVRYVGANPNNYVSFNNELWRIIGVFNVKSTTEAEAKPRLKLVRNDFLSYKDSEGVSSILKASWDSSASSINGGQGINEWSQADLQKMLNQYYAGSLTECKYCNGPNQATCQATCNNLSKLNTNSIDMIEEVVWNTGAIEYADVTTSKIAYEQERGTKTGKICTTGDYCTDTVDRNSTWQGKVGLIYPSDYSYAGKCSSIFTSSNDNWLNKNDNYWTLTPRANTSYANIIWNAAATGIVGDFGGCNFFNILPSVYLKADAFITSGNGTQNYPYTLNI